jgi:5-bromo-4-chloroindolyl phosphate hydrolysis protein
MNDKSPLVKIFENVVPFIVAGFAIALLIGLLFMFSYVLVWGIIIGAVLWVAATMKQYLFPKPATKKEVFKQSEGRIIEHDDKK